MDIADLIRSARAGEPHAGPFLVSVFGERLLGYARAIGRDLSDVDREFAVEQAIEKAILKIDRFDPRKGSLAGWLRAFVRHALADLRRSRAAIDQLDPEAEEEQAKDEPKQPLDPSVVSALIEVWEALRDTDQLILALRIIEELPHAEIAIRLGGVSEVACRQRYGRALLRLQTAALNHPRLRLIAERRRA